MAWKYIKEGDVIYNPERYFGKFKNIIITSYSAYFDIPWYKDRLFLTSESVKYTREFVASIEEQEPYGWFYKSYGSYFSDRYDELAKQIFLYSKTRHKKVKAVDAMGFTIVMHDYFHNRIKIDCDLGMLENDMKAIAELIETFVPQYEEPLQYTKPVIGWEDFLVKEE
ncbi:MAG: hypothetical protein E7363_05455 [Clostridiales bacterium]|nr:hypothetical protein [Clostridiales bacterium]